MRALTLVQGSLFAVFVLGVAAAALSRIVPFHLPAGADWFDGKVAKAFESHYDERFPGRTLGTNIWAAIDYLLFDEGRPGVVVGRDDWLYTDEEFKTYPDAEASVATHLALIPWVRDELARHGTQLVVALVPSKARIYPEHIGARRPATLHDGLYDRARSALLDAGIAAPDLARALDACKRGRASGPGVFLRTDTHWTPAGAQCAALALRAATPVAALPGHGHSRAAAYRTRVERVAPHRGDLFSFLPLDPYFSALLPPAEEIEVRRTELASATDVDGLLGDAAAPQVVLVGTSYSADARWNLTGALQEALQGDVVNYAQVGKGPFEPMLDYLLNSDAVPAAPRLLVWEIPERYLPIAQDLRVERNTPTPAPCPRDGDQEAL